MATKIETPRIAPREVQGGEHTYIVALARAGLLIRLKGSRTTYGPVSYDALFHMAVRLDGVR